MKVSYFPVVRGNLYIRGKEPWFIHRYHHYSESLKQQEIKERGFCYKMTAFHFSVIWVDNCYTGHMSQLIIAYLADMGHGSFQQKMKTRNNMKSYFMRWAQTKVILVKKEKITENSYWFMVQTAIIRGPSKFRLVSCKSNILKQSLCANIFFAPYWLLLNQWVYVYMYLWHTIRRSWRGSCFSLLPPMPIVYSSETDLLICLPELLDIWVWDPLLTPK